MLSVWAADLNNVPYSLYLRHFTLLDKAETVHSLIKLNLGQIASGKCSGYLDCSKKETGGNSLTKKKALLGPLKIRVIICSVCICTLINMEHSSSHSVTLK